MALTPWNPRTRMGEMGFLTRLKDVIAQPRSSTRSALTRSPDHTEAPAGPENAFAGAKSLPVPEIHAVLRVEEVADARFYINDLFRRRFGGDAPDYPRHFVAMHATSPGHLNAVGYVHYSPFEDSWLCGGMVMDERAYRRMPVHHRAAVRSTGGVAEFMLRETFARLRDAPAIWGYVGDRLAEAVDLRAGFVHTGEKHLMVVWNRELSEPDRLARLARVKALGPF